MGQVAFILGQAGLFLNCPGCQPKENCPITAMTYPKMKLSYPKNSMTCPTENLLNL